MIAEIDIENTGIQGQGVGRTPQGQVLFVNGALPGDRVSVEFPESVKRYADAQLLSFLHRSPHRVENPCAYFGECGGCTWLDWDYEEQIDAKQKTLLHTLARAGLKPKLIGDFLRAKKISGFRTRIQVRQDGNQVGFFKRRSHDIVDVSSCYVAHPSLNEEIGKLRAEPCSERRRVEIALAPNGQISRNLNAPSGAKGFIQANESQNAVLQAMVSEQIRRQDVRVVLELYCGDGNLTFEYAKHVNRILAYDGNRNAISIAATRASKGKLDLSFCVSSIGVRLAKNLAKTFDSSYDTLLVDPPRKGMGGCLKSFIHPNLKHIIYVSCSPVAFSKDVRDIASLGFTLDYVQGLDMFPHTPHLELVATFVRS